VITKIAGAEAVIGRVRMEGDQLFVLASDSQSVTERYRVGPFGTYSEGYRATYFAVVDNTLAVSDFRGRLQLYNAQSGAPERTLELTDKVELLCPSTKAQHLYVQQVDKKRLDVDVVSGKTSSATRAPDCDSPSRPSRRRAVPKAPQVAGTRTKNVLIDGDYGIVEAVKSPGTPHQKVVGFDPKTRKLRFEQWLAAVDKNLVNPSEGASALGQGRYVAVYKVGTETWHATALNPSSGDRLWDIALRGIFAVDSIDGLSIGEQFVYIERTSSLDVLDAKTGELKGAVGNETYDK
jgi:hypothetical protein